MSRFYIPPGSVKKNTIVISGKEACHILDVMRLKILDKVVTFDGTGREYVGFIKEVKGKTLIVDVQEVRTPSQKETPKISLIQAVPKKDKMDYIVEKATELGVSSIIPVITERTIPKWDAVKKAHQVKRWSAIAKEAAKQSGRVDIPNIDEVRDFHNLLRGLTDYGVCIMAALSDKAIPLRDALKDFKGDNIAIAIGPEGDFTAREVEAALKIGFKIVSLGARVLKSDTAGVSVLSILNYELA